jgi:hypothetical protein
MHRKAPCGIPFDCRVAVFQQVFAEYSAGKGWVHVTHVRWLLQDMGLKLSPTAVLELLEDTRKAKAPGWSTSPRSTGQFSYDEAFEVYLRANAAALPPRNPEKVVQSAIHTAVDNMTSEAMDSVDAERVLVTSPDPPSPPTSRPVSRQDEDKALSPKHKKFVIPPAGSPRRTSLFKRVGRFTLDPKPFVN